MPKNEIKIQDIIACVRRRLSDEGSRIAETPTKFELVWWPSSPTLEGQLSSDYGARSGAEQLNHEFDVEIGAIQECLEQTGYVPDFEKWQMSDGPAGDMYSSLNTRAMALFLWGQVAFPMRRCGDIVYRICPPRDVSGGRPLIDALLVDDFVRGISLQSAGDKLEIAQLKRNLVLWRRAASVGIIASVLLVIALLLV